MLRSLARVGLILAPLLIAATPHASTHAAPSLVATLSLGGRITALLTDDGRRLAVAVVTPDRGPVAVRAIDVGTGRIVSSFVSPARMGPGMTTYAALDARRGHIILVSTRVTTADSHLTIAEERSGRTLISTPLPDMAAVGVAVDGARGRILVAGYGDRNAKTGEYNTDMMLLDARTGRPLIRHRVALPDPHGVTLDPHSGAFAIQAQESNANITQPQLALVDGATGRARLTLVRRNVLPCGVLTALTAHRLLACLSGPNGNSAGRGPLSGLYPVDPVTGAVAPMLRGDPAVNSGDYDNIPRGTIDPATNRVYTAQSSIEHTTADGRRIPVVQVYALGTGRMLRERDWLNPSATLSAPTLMPTLGSLFFIERGHWTLGGVRHAGTRLVGLELGSGRAYVANEQTTTPAGVVVPDLTGKTVLMDRCADRLVVTGVGARTVSLVDPSSLAYSPVER